MKNNPEWIVDYSTSSISVKECGWNYVTPFLKRINSADSTCIFRAGFLNVIKEASKNLRTFNLSGACIKICHVNEWSMLLRRWRAGSDLWSGLFCSFRSFNGKSCLIFLVIHLITIEKPSLVKRWNFVRKRFTVFSFAIKNGNSSKINGFGNSKSQEGMIGSSSSVSKFLLLCSRIKNSLTTLSVKCGGKPMHFCTLFLLQPIPFQSQ